MTITAARTQCPNCDAPLLSIQPPPAHCPRCGQATRLHAPTFFEFIHEFVGHYVALEGALWRTLGNLFFRPGRLTSEYIAGRRRKYVLPLRLYITASFLFFLIVKVFGTGVELEITVAPSELAAPAASGAASDTNRSHCLTQPDQCNLVERITAKARDLASRPEELQNKFIPDLQRQMLSMAPYAALVMQPLFAGLIQLAYRNRRRPYGEYFLFSLHMHAFWFLALLLFSVLPAGWDAAAALLVVPHGLLAMRQVYRGRWWALSLRWLAVSGAYAAALALTALALALFVAFIR